ncbi:hypothetical protein [Comamonas sp. B-9]|uniref:hypothetical protein n=1 Tax=Comamonas sp. B-9 TaxID=1055192 RepID=UPI0003955980|nr:hypothetical protein [Comamonas sp. B-9]
MEHPISTHFWGLYAAGEFRLLQQFCELGNAVELLAFSATEQESRIPDCAACEVRSLAFSPILQFIENFPDALPSSFETGLQRIAELGYGLSDSALRCGDRQIFCNPEWEPVRHEAKQILAMLDWESLKPHIDDVLYECRRVN